MTTEPKDETCHEVAEVYGPNLPSNPNPLWIGWRFAPLMEIRFRVNGTPIAKRADKHTRRRVRAALLRNTRVLRRTSGPLLTGPKVVNVARELAEERVMMHEAQRHSSNSHEAKRLIAADRKWRREIKQAERAEVAKRMLDLKMQKVAGTDKPIERSSTDSSGSPSPAP